MSTLQQRVAEALKAGHKKAHLARAAGVSSASVSHWVQGRTHQVSGESAVGLAKLTGWCAEWWLGKTTVKVPPPAGPAEPPMPPLDDLVAAVVKIMPRLSRADQQAVLTHAVSMLPEPVDVEAGH